MPGLPVLDCALKRPVPSQQFLVGWATSKLQKGGGAGKALQMENKGVIAISELAENLKSNKERQITREEFKAVLRQYLSGPHVDQQITQLWDKVELEGLAANG